MTVQKTFSRRYGSRLSQLGEAENEAGPAYVTEDDIGETVAGDGETDDMLVEDENGVVDDDDFSDEFSEEYDDGIDDVGDDYE